MSRVEIDKQPRAAAIASLKEYFDQNMPDAIGDLAAGLLLDFFLEEVGPVIYNKAVADAQTRMQQRVADLPGELYEDEFQYWSRAAAKLKRR